MYFLNKGRKLEETKEKLIMFGFAAYYLGLSVARIFFFLRELQIQGIYIDHTFYGDWNNAYPLYDIFLKSAYVSIYVGFFFFLLSFERNYKRTKYILSICNGIFIVLIIIFPLEIARNLTSVFFVFDFLLYFLIFFYFLKRSNPNFQSVLSFIMFGTIIYLAGHLFDTTVLRNLSLMHPILPPILHIIGALIIISPAFIDREYLRRFSIYWIVSIIVILIIYMYAIINYVGFNSNLPYFNPILAMITLAAGLIIAIFFFILFLYHARKRVSLGRLPDKEKKEQDFLEIFTKTQKVTEEEVSISKEKKICLVCKNKILGHTFVCKKCESFYCNKCYQALTSLENSCWACDSALDQTKPIKIPEQIKSEKKFAKQNVHKIKKIRDKKEN